MKIRTKLIGLLSALLLLVSLTSTLAGWLMLRSRITRSVREDAQANVTAIANSLEDYLQSERSDEDIRARLEAIRQRYNSIVALGLSFSAGGGDVIVTGTGDDPARVERPRRAPRPERAQQYEARRVLIDHAESLDPPLSRAGEPLWRLADRGSSTRWSRAIPLSLMARRNRDFKSSESQTACPPNSSRCMVISTAVEPFGAPRGQLSATVTTDRFDKVLFDQLGISLLTMPAALLILLISTAWIVNRVVGRRVSELSQAMHEVEGGDLRRRVAEEQADEIGNLARGFNQMLTRLGQADDEIRALNTRLADDIRAATQDLQRKNEALAQLNGLLVETQRELGDKERLAALGQLAAQLAHEIGTPLASVSGHLQLAGLGRDVSPQLKERLQVAIGELSRVSKIIRDYLDQTRTAKPTLVRADLRKVVEEAIRVAGSAARYPQVRVTTEINPEMADLVTDPGLLRQILINLLTNALDATAAAMAGESGRVPSGAAPPPRTSGANWKTERVVVSVRPGATAAETELSVRDHGTGIASEDLVRIFEPFYTTKGRGRGTGLGLSICRELTRTLGGQLRVNSTPGNGSEFTVVLPRT